MNLEDEQPEECVHGNTALDRPATCPCWQNCVIPESEFQIMKTPEHQITAGGLRNPTPLRPRFEIVWDGYSESCFKVADNQTRAILKEFDCALLGTNTARNAASKLVTILNGELRQCPECGGLGREQAGPSEQSCRHCNGGGFQIFKQ